MTVKQYLRQAYNLNSLIYSHIRELEQLQTLLTNYPINDLTKPRVQGGNINNDRINGIVARIIELEKQITDEVDGYIDIKTEIHRIIQSVSDPTERLILRCRYLEFMTWESVAECVNYSLKQVYRIHGEALKKLNDGRIKIKHKDSGREFR